MARKESYRGYNDIGEIASVIRESQSHGNPYSNRTEPFSEYGSLFSAVCGVLTITDEERKKELLGDQAYSRLCELYDEMANGNTELFRDVYYESTTKRYHAPSNLYEQATELIEPGPEDILRLILKPDSSRRLLAAKIRKEFFPTETEYDESLPSGDICVSRNALFRRIGK